jgi:hypothetical protein
MVRIMPDQATRTACPTSPVLGLAMAARQHQDLSRHSPTAHILPEADRTASLLLSRASITQIFISRQQLLIHHPRDVGQDARPIHLSSTPADSRLIAKEILASVTRRGYAENGQLTVFSTVSIFWPYAQYSRCGCRAKLTVCISE